MSLFINYAFRYYLYSEAQIDEFLRSEIQFSVTVKVPTWDYDVKVTVRRIGNGDVIIQSVISTQTKTYSIGNARFQLMKLVNFLLVEENRILIVPMWINGVETRDVGDHNHFVIDSDYFEILMYKSKGK